MKRLFIAFFAIAVLLGTPAVSKAVTLPPAGSYALTYGDFYSYSLPVLAYFYDRDVESLGTGPGNPYYVPSSPGHLADSVVIATGSNGNVVHNYPGMDDAYETPNKSSADSFSTATTSDPDPVLANDQADAWDASIQSFID